MLPPRVSPAGGSPMPRGAAGTGEAVDKREDWEQDCSITSGLGSEKSTDSEILEYCLSPWATPCLFEPRHPSSVKWDFSRKK